MRRLIFAALVLGMALSGAVIAAAGHSTWSWTSPFETSAQKGIADHFTITKGDPDSGPGGNVECDVLQVNTAKLDAEDINVGVPFKVGAGYVVITRFDGNSLDWRIANASDGAIYDSLNLLDAYQVIVKGGPASMLYFYNSTYADYGWGLTAPVNPNNDKDYGISNVRFCFDDKA